MIAHIVGTLVVRYSELNPRNMIWIILLCQWKKSIPWANKSLFFLQQEITNSIHFTWKFKAVLLTEGGKMGNKQLIPLHEDCGYIYITIYNHMAVSKWIFFFPICSVSAHHCGDRSCRRGTSAYHGHSTDCHLLPVGTATSPGSRGVLSVGYTTLSAPHVNPEGPKHKRRHRIAERVG